MRRYNVLESAVVVAAALLLAVFGCGPPEITSSVPAERPPRIRPDYSDTVFPPNIAAPSFIVEEEGVAYLVAVRGDSGDEIRVHSREPGITLPLGAWRNLLDLNRGAGLAFEVYVQAADGRWHRFEPVRNAVATEEIDSYIVYRRINLLYNFYRDMQIRQRNLEDYSDCVVLDNRAFGYGCVNCHTFLANGTDKMLVQMRSGLTDYGAGMLLLVDGELRKVDARTRVRPGLAALASWHPSGRAVAFSINRFRQFFHTSRVEVRDAVDTRSDLALYLLGPNEVTSTKAIASPDRLEAWPCWSHDGAHLYFCSAPVLWDSLAKVPPDGYDKVTYDLMRIGYDIDTGEWGEAEPVLLAEDAGLSISQPRTSPDGRSMMVCMTRSGGFPVHDPSSDLFLLDLEDLELERLPWSSDYAETWHSWSSNSRWVVFSSKAGDGVFCKPYFCYIDENGAMHKPFLLPQRDPYFYESFIKLYQMPELVRTPVPLKREQIAGKVRSDDWLTVDLPVTAATPAEGPLQAEPYRLAR